VISDCPLINLSVILDRAKLSIFLLDEEEGGGVRAFGQADIAFLYVLLHKLLQFFLLELSEGIDLSRDGAWGVWLEFDGVIPDSWFWEALGSFFSKDFVVSLVMGWYGGFWSALPRGT
jgi:hypothetical protein